MARPLPPSRHRAIGHPIQSPDLWEVISTASTLFSPEQWRILGYLYLHKLHTVRPKLTHVCKAQKVTCEDLDRLTEAGFIAGEIDRTDLGPEIGLHRISSHIQRVIRLRLTAAGLRIVLSDPGNQIRYTLGQYDKPISVAKLFDDGNTITVDDLAAMQTRGLITVALPEVGEFEVNRSLLLFRDFFTVALTPKGREYLPL